MEYAQLNEELTEAIQITSHGNIEWDANHFCPAASLTPEEATYFRVVPLTVTEPPEYNPITQQVIRNGCRKINGIWEYKWDIIEKIDDQAGKEQTVLSYDPTIPLLPPGVITMRQARLALFRTGNLALVESAIESMASPQKEEAKIEWEYSQQINRTNNLVSVIGNMLGLTDVELDKLFILAASL